MRRFLILAGFGLLLFAACRSKNVAVVPDPQPQAAVSQSGEISFPLNAEQQKSPLLKTMTVTPEPLEIALDALGSIASDTDQTTQVRPVSPGHVTALLATVGDQVRAGQPLVRYRAGGREITLAAPSAGAILGVYGEVGDYVDPLMPLVTLGDTRRLRSVLDVFEKDIGKIRKGQAVTIRTSAFPDDTFKGMVVYISPRVDEDTRTIKVRVDIENPDGELKFGMFVNGKILVDTRTAFVVPETALETIEDRPSIFVFKDKTTLSVRPVTVGEKIDGHVEIRSGLKDGDRIISEGSFILKNEAVKARNGEAGDG